MMSIADNLNRIRERILEAESKAGRAPGSVRLLAVSKTFPPEDVRAAFDAGQTMFGENRVQELTAKAAALPHEIEWHLIGQLQSNKVAKAVEAAHWIHSVDSEKLVRRIANAANAAGRRINILFEVNSGEENKSGFRDLDELKRSLEFALKNEAALRIQGLMTMAAFGAPEAELRRTFARLRALRDSLRTEFGSPLPELSMGMSADFVQAVMEGATIVRIGTAIFGGR